MNIEFINGVLLGSFFTALIVLITNIVMAKLSNKKKKEPGPTKDPKEFRGYTKTFVVEVRSTDNDIIVRSSGFTVPYLTEAYKKRLSGVFNSIKFHEIRKIKEVSKKK